MEFAKNLIKNTVKQGVTNKSSDLKDQLQNKKVCNKVIIKFVTR